MIERNFKTAYFESGFRVTLKEIFITNISEDNSLPEPFVEAEHTINKWKLTYSNVLDIIKNGKKVYYIVYSDCRMTNRGRWGQPGKYRKSSYAALFYSKSKKAVRDHVMKNNTAARGFGNGRCINCLLELSEMHPYEVTLMLNSSLSREDKLDDNKYRASYRKDYPGVMNPAFIDELCAEHEKEYGESVDAWKEALK